MESPRINFKCIICNDLPPAISNLYHCQTGHLVCGLCFTTCSDCIECNEPLRACPLAWSFLDPDELKYKCFYPRTGGKTVKIPRDDLDCQRCFKFPIPPIHNCRNGHLVCGSCSYKDNSCPNCIDGLEECSLAGKLLAEIEHEFPKPCRYQEQGCTTVLTEHKMKIHVLRNCEYRWITCSGRGYDFCGTRVTAGDINSHLKTVHLLPEKVNENGEFSDTLVWQRFDPPTTFYEVKFDEESFLVSRAVENGIFSFWISVDGDNEVANKYEFELTLRTLDFEENAAETKPEVYRKLHVIPIHRSQVRLRKNVITLNYKDIIHIFQETNAEHSVTKFKSKYACCLKYKINKV